MSTTVRIRTIQLFSLNYRLFQFCLCLEHFISQHIHGVSRCHHHLHHEDVVMFFSTLIELPPGHLSQHVSPALSLVIVPIELKTKFQDLSVEPQHLHIGQRLVRDD